MQPKTIALPLPGLGFVLAGALVVVVVFVIAAAELNDNSAKNSSQSSDLSTEDSIRVMKYQIETLQYQVESLQSELSGINGFKGRVEMLEINSNYVRNRVASLDAEVFKF